MNHDKIENLEDAFFYMADQVAYGDITNMDIYWDGISSAIIKLSIKNRIKTSQPNRPKLLKRLLKRIKRHKKPDLPKVSTLLESLPIGLVPDKLIEGIKEMEELTEKNSDDTFDSSQLDDLREVTDDVEVLFKELINNLKEYNDD